VHGDETPVPVLAKHQTRKGRLSCTCVMTSRSPVLLRRSRCSSTRATGRPSMSLKDSSVAVQMTLRMS